MELIKKQSKQTYVDENNKTHHYHNYFLQCDNGKRIQIKPVFKDDKRCLDFIAKYER